MAGIGGITHGVGEVVQGRGSTGGIVFNSWAEGRIARNLGGEPAMGLIPDLLLTGIVTIVTSLAVLVWSVTSMKHRYAGGGLVVLCMSMLLVGGGFGPSVLGMLVGRAAAAARPRRRSVGRLFPTRADHLLGALWPYLFWICVLDATVLVIGSLLLAGVPDVATPDVFVHTLFPTLAIMPLTIAAGVLRTSPTPVEGTAVPQTRAGVRSDSPGHDSKGGDPCWSSFAF
jgi:hypothetical protein